jgi:hypothetical protein
MDKNQVDIMIREGRLKLTFWQYIDHYFIVLFLLVVPGIITHDLYKIYVSETYEGARSVGELSVVAIGFLLLSIGSFYVQRRKLKFLGVRIKYTSEEFQKAIDQTINLLKWRVEFNEGNFFRAYRPWNWTASWGEMITIIKVDEGLYMNSICNLNGNSIISWGWNKKNIKVFLNNLKETIDNSNMLQEN